MATYRDFFTALLTKMGYPVSMGNLMGLAAVSVFEGPNDPGVPPARYNPLNSEVQYGTSTAWNSVGVQDYKNFTQGVNGTAQLLVGSHWGGVRSALRNDVGFQGVKNAFSNAYTWAHFPVGITADSAVQRLNRTIGTGPNESENDMPLSSDDLAKIQAMVNEAKTEIMTALVKDGVVVRQLMAYDHKSFPSVEAYFTGVPGYVPVAKRLG